MPPPSALPAPERAAGRALARRLLAWYDRSRRDLPWRRTRDPYAIWIAETMLQQTRVAAVIPYYERFLAAFPNPAALARAPERRVLALWSGLGYYSRARNLRRAARIVVERHGGRVPKDPDALRRLPGVGRYTLGALLSIAFGEAWPVLDGNVARVLSRLFAVRADARTSRGSGRLWRIAERLVPARRPGDFNQALMELGATLCAVRAPRCTECPLGADCRARVSGRPEAYPPRRPKPRARGIEVIAALVESRRGVWLEPGRDGVNRGLFDLPSVERRGARGGSHARELEEIARRLTARRIRLQDWTGVGRIRHGILDRRYLVHLYRARARRASGTRDGTWLGASGSHELPLTARARKAIALLTNRFQADGADGSSTG